MLLYVDKKKQKRKKIKITSFILTFIFIVLANILHFNKTLHQTDAHLTEYQNIKTTHDWFYSSDTIQIFTKKNKQIPLIIIIPQKITRENAEIFAYALTLANKHTSIKLSSSIANNNILQTITEHIIPQNQLINYSEYLLITNDIKDANKIIYKEKLYPTFLTYKNTKKNEQQIKHLINNLFPLPQEASTLLEKEFSSLKEFSTTYKNELINSFSTNYKHNFTTHGLFLKNASICINYLSQKICEINNNNSLEKNIKNIIKQNIDISKITNINLLTSLKEITEKDVLEPNEGLILQFKNRKEVLLPKEIKNIPENKTPFYVIKENLGINPKYISPNMKYYKFKTLEVKLNDKI